MAAGSIIIDLLMRTGSFSTDTKRAEASLKKFQKQAVDTGKTIGLALGVGITAAVVAFDQLVKSVADFKDFEETIGASAESIASLSIAAATAGVSMDSITGATIKLTKGLTGVDDESKAAGAALAALGLNIEDFKRLDPVAQYEAVGKALAGFADGAQKTAVAVALFGKTGAEQLKVFKALEEAGGRQVILSQQQIELADAYADAQAKQIATLKAYAQVAAVDVLPALNDLITAGAELIREFTGIDTAGKKLAGDSPVKEFAEGAVDALAFVIDAGQGVVRAFQAVGTTIGGMSASIAAVIRGDFEASAAIEKELRANLDALDNAEFFSAKLARIRDASARARVVADDAETQRLAARSRASQPQLQFDGPTKEVKAQKDKTTEADKYLESLAKQIQKTQELTEVERVLDDIVNGRFEGAKAGQAFQALALADEIDRTNQLADSTKKLVEEAERMEDASNRLRDAGKAVFDQTRTPAEQYATELARINGLLQAGAINADTYERAVAQLQDQFDENAQRIKAIAQTINASVEGGFVDAFAGFIDGSLSAGEAFSRFARGVISDMARIAAQDLAKSLFSSGSNGTGGIGGLLASLFGSSTTGLGSASVNDPYSVPMATGTNVVPYDGFRATLHKGEAVVPAKYNPAAGGSSGGSIQVINPPGVPLQAQAREERQPDGSSLRKIILSVMQDDARTGGPYSQTQASTFGLKRQLPRMGR